jgi:hypothetical protein
LGKPPFGIFYCSAEAKLYPDVLKCAQMMRNDFFSGEITCWKRPRSLAEPSQSYEKGWRFVVKERQFFVEGKPSPATKRWLTAKGLCFSFKGFYFFASGWYSFANVLPLAALR